MVSFSGVTKHSILEMLPQGMFQARGDPLELYALIRPWTPLDALGCIKGREIASGFAGQRNLSENIG